MATHQCPRCQLKTQWNWTGLPIDSFRVSMSKQKSIKEHGFRFTCPHFRFTGRVTDWNSAFWPLNLRPELCGEAPVQRILCPETDDGQGPGPLPLSHNGWWSVVGPWKWKNEARREIATLNLAQEQLAKKLWYNIWYNSCFLIDVRQH